MSLVHNVAAGTVDWLAAGHAAQLETSRERAEFLGFSEIAIVEEENAGFGGVISNVHVFFDRLAPTAPHSPMYPDQAASIVATGVAGPAIELVIEPNEDPSCKLMIVRLSVGAVAPASPSAGLAALDALTDVTSPHTFTPGVSRLLRIEELLAGVPLAALTQYSFAIWQQDIFGNVAEASSTATATTP